MSLQTLSRREFLSLLPVGAAGAGTGALGWATGSTRGAPFPDSPERAPAPGARARPIGIQLYTVREAMAMDAARTLVALGRMGYAEVETAGLHGHEPADFRRMLDDAGLISPAGHVSLPEVQEGLATTLDTARTLGQRWLVVPWIPESERTADGYRRLGAIFEAVGEAALGAGLRFAYHNHDFDLAPLHAEGEAPGVVPLELLLSSTDPTVVDFELDVYWVRSGGGDPLDYLERWPERFRLMHVKDMASDGSMVTVGQGVVDWTAVVDASDAAGTVHYFVEHDEPVTPLRDADAALRHLRALGF